MVAVGPQYFKAAKSYALAALSSMSYPPNEVHIQLKLHLDQVNLNERLKTGKNKKGNWYLTKVNCRSE